MSSRNERFADGCLSLELTLDGADPEKANILSDRGLGVYQLESACDGWPCRCGERGDYESANMVGAVLRLKFAELDHLVETLILIVENRSLFRGDSIKALCRDNRRKACIYAAKRRYERNRKQLLRFFMSLSVHGDIEGRD